MTQHPQSTPQPSASYFAEHLGVISALEENFQHAEEDFASLQAIHDVYDTLQDLCKQKEHNVRDIIRGLVEECTHAQQEATYPKDEREHADLVQRYETDIKACSTDVYSMESQLRALQEQEVDIDTKMKELVAYWNALTEQEKVEPRLRHILSLYINVTKITWNLGTLNDERVKGTIDIPDAGVLEDVLAGDDFDSVNALWETLGQATVM